MHAGTVTVIYEFCMNICCVHAEHPALFHVTTEPAPKYKRKNPQALEMGRKSLSIMVTAIRSDDKSLCGNCQMVVKSLSNKMIQCDSCDQWYHYKCMGVAAKDAATIEFVCPGGYK